MIASCSQEPSFANPVPPSVARAKIHSWHGDDVFIQGWLGECKALNCRIFDTLAEAKLVSNANPRSKTWKKAMDNSVSIGSALNFDEVAAPMQFQEVQLFGRMSAQCRGFFGGCTDRAPDIQPAAIGLAADYRKEK